MILLSIIHWDASRTLGVRICLLLDFDVARPFTHARGCLVAKSLFWDSPAAGHISDLSSDMIVLSIKHWGAFGTIMVPKRMLSDFYIERPIFECYINLIAFNHFRIHFMVTRSPSLPIHSTLRSFEAHSLDPWVLVISVSFNSLISNISYWCSLTLGATSIFWVEEVSFCW